MTLRTAINFGEFLAILSPFAPTPSFAGFVARCAISFCLLELVDVQIFCVLSRDDFFPFYGLDVA